MSGHRQRSAGAESLERRQLLSGGYAYQSTAAFQDPLLAAGRVSPLVADRAGNLYGTVIDAYPTTAGTPASLGIVFRIARGTGVAQPIADFTADTGTAPAGRLAIDPAGDLFGVTSAGGTANAGTVWELRHGASTITVRASLASAGLFAGSDLFRDPAGNLYCTTAPAGGNATDPGELFELTPNATVPVVLAAFDFYDPEYPAVLHAVESAGAQGIYVDRAGNAFGYTANAPELWEVVKGSHTVTDLGAPATGPVVADNTGDLFARSGSSQVVELRRGATVTHVVADFGDVRIEPNLAVNAAGDVFGTTDPYDVATRANAGPTSAWEVVHRSHAVRTLQTFSLPAGTPTDAFDGLAGAGLWSDPQGRLYGVTYTKASYGLAEPDLNSGYALRPVSVYELSPGHIDAGQVPTVTATVSAPTAVDPAVTGESASVQVTLANHGRATARVRSNLSLYLSTDGSFDLPVLSPSLTALSVNLPAHRSKRYTVSFTLPLAASTGDSVLATLTPAVGASPAPVSGVAVTSAGPFGSILPEFGQVGSRAGVPLVFAAPDGHTVTYVLTGPGTGTVDASTDASNPLVTLTGTTADSTLTITASVATGTAGYVLVDGSIGAIDAPGIVAVKGGCTVNGDVGHISLGGLTTGNIVLHGSQPVTLSLGDVTDSELVADGPIASLAVSSWANPNQTVTVGPNEGVTDETDGTIMAPSIGTFDDAGAFGGQLAVGSVSTLHIGGDASGYLLVGASWGRDQSPGNGDDTFAAGQIGTLTIDGSVLPGTVIAAGLDVADDAFPPTARNATLLRGGSIGPITIGGPIGTGASIVSASLPAQASVDGTEVATATSAGFSLPA